MSQFTNSSLSGYHTHMLRFVHRVRRLSRAFRTPSTSKLLFELEGATTLTETAVAWRRDAHSAIVQNFVTVAREIATNLT